MIQYLCDGCGMRLKENAERYIITIDATRADIAEDFNYEDYLNPDEDISFWGIEDGEDEEKSERGSWRFDLCRHCYAIYTSDPMAIVALKRGHSRN